MENPEFQHLFEESDKGDTLAKKLVQHCLHAWSICAINMVHSFDPGRIIISGGIMRRKNDILPYLLNMVDKHTWNPPGSVEIVAAEQTDFAGLLGLEYLIHAQQN